MTRGILLLAGFCQLFMPGAAAQTRPIMAADIQGDVTDSTTGKVIPGARIKLKTVDGEPLYVKADERGHFKAPDIAPGLYVLAARAPGYLDSLMQAVDLRFPSQRQDPRILVEPKGMDRAPAKPQPVTLTFTEADGTLHVSVAVRLTAYAVVSGKVTDPYGIPLPGWSVEVREKVPAASPNGRNEFGHRVSALANDRGEYRIARIEPGTYYVAATSPSELTQGEATYRQTYYPGVLAAENAKPFLLAPGQQARADLRIVQQGGVRVAGHIIKPPGYPTGPQVYTNVVLAPEPLDLGNPSGPSTTGQDDYQIKDVLPGRYVLMALTRDASTDPYGGSQKEILGLMRPIEVGAHDMDDVDLTLAPFHDVAGSVSFDGNCPAISVRISGQPAVPMSMGKAEAVVDADGHFLLHGLSTGRYRFSVYAEPGPNLGLPVVSMTLGDRDILKDGVDSPYAGDEPLHITLGCRGSRRAQ
jgi:hypothetical protein